MNLESTAAEPSMRRRGRLAALAAGLSLALVACTGGGASSGSPAASAPSGAPSATSPASESPAVPAEPVELGLMLSYIPSVQFFPPLLADGLGYFEEEGLDVDIQPSEGSSFVVQQVAGGNIVAGVPASQSILLGFAQSPNFKAVYQFANRSFGVYVLEDSPVQSLEDLRGTSIGTPDLAGGETLALRIALEAAGLQQGTDVRVEALGYNELGMAEALQNGRVSALSIYWSTSAIANHAGIPVRCITCPEDAPDVGMAVIVADSFLESNRDAVARLGRALAKATLFAQTNPEAAIDVIRKVSPEGSTDVDQLRESLRVALDAIAPRDGGRYGANDTAAWQALMEGMLSPGSQSGLTEEVDVSALVDDSLVAEFNDFDHAAVEDAARSYTP
jgi:NitT/TauT family transport system substrate-binding protein